MTLPISLGAGGRVTPPDAGAALSALDALPGASALVFDRDLRYILCAGQALAERGLSPSALEGHLARDVIPPDRWALYEPMYLAALTGQRSSTEVLDPDRERRYVVDVGPRHDSAGAVVGGVAVARDVTAHRRVEGKLHEAQRLFEQAFEEAPIGMGLVRLDGQWMRVNRALCEITGYSAEELRNRTFADITHPDDVESDVAETRGLVAGVADERHTEMRYINKQGETLWVSVSVSVVRDGAGNASYLIAQVVDVSRQKRLEQRLRHLADFDSLTGLPNRRYFEEALSLQAGRCARYEEMAGLMMLDLDGFKAVNDHYGHRAGDELLKAVAAAIRTRIRASDLAGRLGGDEFAVLLLNARRSQLDALAAELADAVTGARIDVAGASVGTTVSVGTTFLDAEHADPEAALARADKAMYAEKARHARRS